MRFAIHLMMIGLLTGAAHASEVAPCPREALNAERRLCHEVVVTAPVAEIWRLISTSDGWRSWAAPLVHLDLRPGGLIETSYSVDGRLGDPGNIRNLILAVTPERALALQIANVPPGFPYEHLARQLVTAIELHPVDEARTRVRVVMTGYRNEPGFDQLYAFFDRGNALTLANLNERVERGPIDWEAVTAPEADQQ